METLTQMAAAAGYEVPADWPAQPEGEITFPHPKTPIVFHLGMRGTSILGAWYSFRTTSYEFENERTDLHELITNLFAVFLRSKYGFSPRLRDELNPAIDIPGEIYARYVSIEQPDIVGADISSDQTWIKALLEAPAAFQAVLDQHLGKPLAAQGVDTGTDFSVEPEWFPEYRNTFGHTPDGSELTFCNRKHPAWLWVQDIKRKVTLIESPGLANMVQTLVADTKWTEVDEGDGVWIYRSGHLRMEVDSNNFEVLDLVCKAVDEETPETVDASVPMENMLATAVGNHVIFIYGEFGISDSQHEIDLDS